MCRRIRPTVHSVRHAQAIFAAFKDVFAEHAHGSGREADVVATSAAGAGREVADTGADTGAAQHVASKTEYFPRVVVAPTAGAGKDATIRTQASNTEARAAAVPVPATTTTITTPQATVLAAGGAEEMGHGADNRTRAAAHEAREKIRVARAEAKQLAGTVNGIKSEIDAAMEAINRQQAHATAVIKDELVFEEDQEAGVGTRPLATRQMPSNSVDVELARTLKNAKQRYRAAFTRLQQAKKQVQHLATAKASIQRKCENLHVLKT